jgi:hypothetical protein
MYKRYFLIIAGVMFLLWGCESAQGGQGVFQPAESSTSKPVITEAYASKGLRFGDTWKIYLKGSDSSSDMDTIIATMFQPGRGGGYPPSYIRIRDGNKRDLSGYIYWNSGEDMQQGLMFTSLTLTVQIKDKAGNISTPVTFPLHFQMTRQELPPPGIFANNELGPVMVRILPLARPD